jgi:hypothetical protein
VNSNEEKSTFFPRKGARFGEFFGGGGHISIDARTDTSHTHTTNAIDERDTQSQDDTTHKAARV